MIAAATERIKAFLASIEPFKSLSPRSLALLTAAAKLKTYAKGDTIYGEGEKADGVWVLHEGRVQVLKSVSDGRPLAMETLAPGELFGTLCRLGRREKPYPCTAVAAEPSSVVWILERVFFECYRSDTGFVRGLCTLCAERLQDAQGLRCLGQESVAVRIAATLVRLEQVHGSTIPFTKKALSEIIGAALETTFRSLAEFEKSGVLTSQRGKIIINDLSALRSACEET